MFYKNLLAFSLMAASVAHAQEAEPKGAYEIARDTITQIIEQKKKEFAGNPDVMVLDSLMADRKKKIVEIYACSTSIAATDPVEFFITPANSGKDYESLTITWAKPSDIHKALEFIGLKPGHPINFNTNHHWSRGPRVVMKMVRNNQPVRAEQMVVDTETTKPLALTGLIFAGSFTHTDEDGKTHYAADMVDSKAIAPNYNDPVAVLDMPRRLSQAEMYGFQKPNPDHMVKIGTLTTVTLEPGVDADAIQSRDLKIEMSLTDGKPTYVLHDADKPAAAVGALPHLVESVSKLADGKTDLFTTVSIAPDVPVNDVRKLYALLMTLEQDRGVKIDPPADAELFHRAFFPQESWRNRVDRLGEPWELFLTRTDGKIVAKLERQVEVYEADKKIELQKFDAKTPDEFVKAVNDNQSQWSKAIFIYPPADLTYGELMSWARPVLATYPRVFVFTSEPATTQPATQPQGG